MIRLSRLADYAVVLLSRMASRPEAVHTAVDIAQATGVPTPTVSKLLATLGRDGMLRSVRGAKGGYALALAPTEITVARIIAAIDGPIAITTCLEQPSHCDVASLCPSRGGWAKINLAIQSALDGVTLADINAPMQFPLPSQPTAVPVAVGRDVA